MDFTLHSGEVVALLGENGAGKSTLIKALTGVYRRSAGEIRLAGRVVDPKDTADAQLMGIGTVYQEVNLLPNLSVAANLFIGREPVSFGLVSHRKMNARARQILAQYGLAVDLSARVLILDEPTASLDANEVAMLLAILRQLRDEGVGMIFVTHFLDQVYQISDRITVLRNGQLVGTRDAATLPRLELVQMMLGKMFNEADLKRSDRPVSRADPLVAFHQYGRRGMVEPFDLQVRPGEIVGLAGLLGSVRTETAQLLFGIKPADSGDARLAGKRIHLSNPRRASHLGFGYCPEDRKNEGIIGSATVRENIILALQAQRGWFRPLPLREQLRISESFIRLLSIRTPGPEQEIQYLSGGNQQKVLLSRWLATQPRFLILDEPTRGIDLGAHADIIRAIEALCADGMALLVISSELEEMAGYADRIIVLRDRRHVAELECQQISVAGIMQAIAAQPEEAALEQ